ncbi:D-alanyl-D-alanine dipeptidase [Flaviaesturariibacter aridisoli]|uniref:D-alanyl-D-alanine dipeptidase n=2 Tax=Flaviaesturariibacter aridisoli TaxID=2545761 RepID=A0A4V2WNA3_9BACT|nr:D-alanyl-D-alanine dipeptidase [Flaviaesturariibacter aridisoli]
MRQNNRMIRCLVTAGLQLATMVPLSQSCRAQNIRIVGKSKIYRQLIRRDSTQRMVELHTLSPGIRYDLRYATANNFTGRVLYEQGTKTYLRVLPAQALAAAQDSFRKLGLTLKIFDAYRPHAATRLMWDLVHDERYVANPAKGSGHNRGVAVDLTLVDLRSGQELDMGTGFDNFTDTAHSDFSALSPSVLRARALLRGIMEHFGFTVLATEWWHFYWPNDRNYEVLDLPFRKLR